MAKKYNTALLAELPIEEVLTALGAEKKSRGLWSCFNTIFHSNNDKKPSLGVNPEKNICHCFSCGVAGNSIDVAKAAFDGDFKKGCEWLHSYFNIPFLNGDEEYSNHYTSKKQPQREVKYMSLEAYTNKPFKEVDVEKAIAKYKEVSPKWRLMLIYTFVYKYSLFNVADEWRLDKYYSSRGIHPLALKSEAGRIGILTPKKINQLVQQLIKFFSVEDLIQFKILKRRNDGTVSFRYYNKYGFAVVPSFYINSDLIDGLVLRGLYKAPNLPKEFVVSCSDVVKTLPYGMVREELEKKDTFFITEGHIDALSIPRDIRKETGIIAAPGVYALKEEQLGLLKGKKVIIAFDQDKAGQEAASKLAQQLKKVSAIPHILNWDVKWGKDLNELLINNKIQEVLAAFFPTSKVA